MIEEVSVLEGEGFEEVLFPMLLLSVEIWIGGGERGKNHGLRIRSQALLHHLLLQLLLSFHQFHHQVRYFFCSYCQNRVFCGVLLVFLLSLPHPQPWRQLQHPNGVGVGVVPSHPAGQQPQ